jgi:hypothetical protein
MSNCYGDGTPAQPITSREVVEQQRVANRLARLIRAELEESLWLSCEADISPTMTRFIVHYASAAMGRKFSRRIEIDFGVGDLLDDNEWINEIAQWAVSAIRKGDSELIMTRELNFLRLLDGDGSTIYEDGKPHSA